MRYIVSVCMFGLVILYSIIELSADAGARFYEQGDYDKAVEHYREITDNTTDHWQAFYNLGAAAYKAGRVDEAVVAFEKSLGASQTELREKAFYNLGNAYYRMGEASEQQGPMAAIPVYEKALGRYQNALEINPEDEDAKFNAEFVRKRIEELKQQQEQQQQNSEEDSHDQQERKQEQLDQTEPNESNPEGAQAEQDHAKQQQQDEQQQDNAQVEQPNSSDQSEEAQASSRQEPLESSDFDKTRAGIFLDTLQEDERPWNFFPELHTEMDAESDTSKDW